MSEEKELELYRRLIGAAEYVAFPDPEICFERCEMTGKWKVELWRGKQELKELFDNEIDAMKFLFGER